MSRNSICNDNIALVEAGISKNDAPSLINSYNIITTPICNHKSNPEITTVYYDGLARPVTLFLAGFLTAFGFSNEQIISTLFSSTPNPTLIFAVAGSSITCDETCNYNYGILSYFVKLPKNTNKKVKMVWPLINIINELNAVTDKNGIITATVLLTVLSSDIVCDINTFCPLEVVDVVPLLQFTNGKPHIIINNITAELNDNIYKNNVLITAQIFLFRTDNILRVLKGSFTIAIVLLTDFTGTTTFFYKIIDNCDNTLLLQANDDRIEMTFMKNNSTTNWFINYKQPIFSISLNLLYDIAIDMLSRNPQRSILTNTTITPICPTNCTTKLSPILKPSRIN